MIKKLYFEIIFLIFLGALTSLSLPPFNYLIINFLTFTLFFIFLLNKSNYSKSKKLFFIYGWSFGFGYFITNLYWISISLTFDQDLSYLIPLTVILVPSFLALFYGLITFFFIILKPKKIVVSFLLFSLNFGVLEFIRGSILTGFPWNLVAYSFSNHLEILSITSIIGTYGFNLFCISLFTSPALFIINDSKKDISVSIFFLLATVLFYIYGNSYEKKFNEADNLVYDYKIRAIGSTISLDRFYKNVEPISVIEDLIKISNPKTDEKTIFVWPEGIFPDIYQNQLVDYNWLFKEKFSKNHFLIVGINSKSTNNDFSNIYNSLSVYDHELNLLNSYNKINLVPFGEFLPFRKTLSIVGMKTITNEYQSFSKGVQRNIIEIQDKNFSLKILPLICYEIIYSGKIFKKNDFDLIVNISEDGWFGKSIGPRQHFEHSIFRAIESGKYIIRSSNNGISAIINPLGAIEKSLDLGDYGYIDFRKRKIIQPTVFSKYGNKIFVILILLYIFFIISISFIFSFNRTTNGFKNK